MNRTPFQLCDEILNKLAPERLKLILRDHQLIKEGFHIYFVIDHHEISKFCFPIAAYKIGEYSKRAIDDISAEQNAYFEIFYQSTNRPVLLKEYHRELIGLRRYIEFNTAKIYEKSELIEAYVKAIDVNKENLDRVIKNENLVDFLKANLKNILAVASGIYSFGSERFVDLLQNRLLFNKFEAADDKYNDFIDKITVSNNAKLFFKILQKITRQTQFINPSDIVRQEWNDRRDAFVIDKVMQFNNILNKNKIILLYFSSAAKSLELFENSDVQELLPTISNEKYNILRTPRDIFAYLIRKGVGDTLENRTIDTIRQIKESLDFISKIQEVRNHLKEIEQKCINCQEIGTSCESLNICIGIKEYAKLIDRGRREFNNMALISNINYLMAHFENIKEQDPYFYIINFVKQINNEHITKAVEDEVKTIRNLVQARCLFLESLPLDVSVFTIEPVYARRRFVSCLLQEFPFNLKIKEQKLINILQKIQSYILIPQNEKQKNLNMITTALGDYMNFDANAKDNPESDLIRAYIYLVYQREPITQRAYDLCKEMIEKHKPNISEFLYIISFAARHLGFYSKCNDFCNQGIRLYPDDARFYHARALNTFAWFEEKGTDCPVKVCEIVKDCQTAIRKYENDKHMCGMLYNNLAYIHSYKQTECYDIHKALDYLNDLKGKIPKEEWIPLFPEFFDTEATVYYAYYLEKQNEKDCSEELHIASDSIKKAIYLSSEKYPKVNYLEKESQIKKAIKNIAI